jgi:secreted PhoX family phosphatase
MTSPHDSQPLDRTAFFDEDSNTSGNPPFQQVLQARLSRRGLLRGAVGTAATAVLGGIGLSACGGSDDDAPVTSLGFSAVPKSLADRVSVPAGYTARAVYALGDPLAAGVPAYRNDGTDTDFDLRAGDHHDGMEWFGLDADGKPSTTASDRGLIAMNHEATTDEKLSAASSCTPTAARRRCRAARPKSTRN